MPKRHVPSGETNIFEIPLTDNNDKERHWGTRIVLGLGTTAVAVGMSAGALNGAGEAKADNQLVFGGRYDVDSKEYTKFLIETDQIDPATDKIFPIKNPAGMIEMLDGISMNKTTEIAVANAQDVINTQIDPTQQTNTWGYSLGSAPALRTAKNNEGVVDSVTLDKSPYGPGGLSSNEAAKAPDIKAMLDDNGIIINESLPTDIPVMVNSNVQDVFSGGGLLPPDIQKIIDSFMNTFNGPHDMSDPSQPHNVQRFGNVTVAWYGNNPVPTITFDPMVAPAPEVAPAPAPEAAVLVDAVVPAPEAAPAPEGVLVQATAPAPEAVRLATPSFPGELPCIAPDGSQYFTPGNASC